MQNLRKLIEEAENIILLPHDNIDGDSFCSCQAFKMMLESMGKKCSVVAEVPCIKKLEFLGLSCTAFERGKHLGADLAIAVDCADEKRFGERSEIFNGAKKNAVLDHHKTNRGFGMVNVINPDAAAACEIVFELYKEWQVEILPEAAKCIYCGIVTDTGGFRFSNTTAKTLEIAASLLKLGVDAEKINQNIFETKSFGQLKIEALAIEKTKFFHGGRTALCYISKEMQEQAGATDDDMSNVSSVLRCIEGVEVSAVIKEKGDEIRVSMRSKEYADVSEICAHLGGGGHSRAAGATLCCSGDEAVETLAKLIGEHYERCNLCI